MEAVVLKVTGRVQAVGYRRYVLVIAQEQGISGSVKNQDDGSVVIRAQGTAPQVRAFLGRLRSPPLPAKVEGIEEKSARPNPRTKAFRMLSSGAVEELQEGFGAMQNEFSDYRKEFGSFAKRTDTNFKGLGSKLDGFASRTDENFKELGGRFDGFASQTDTNFRSLDTRYGEISDKLSQILSALAGQAKSSQEMLDSVRNESRQTAEALNESLKLLREAVDRLPKPA